MGSRAVLAALLLALPAIAPPAAAQGPHAILLADQVILTEGVPAGLTLRTFVGGAPADADGVAGLAGVLGVPLNFTRTALGTYEATFLPAAPDADAEGVVRLRANSTFGGEVRSAELSLALAPSPAARLTVEASDPAPYPGQTVRITLRLSRNGTAADGLLVSARARRLDRADPPLNIPLAREGVGTYAGNLTVPLEGSSAVYRVEGSALLDGQRAAGMTHLHRRGAQVWLRVLEATPVRLSVELWGVDYAGAPLNPVTYTLRANAGEITQSADAGGRALFTFDAPGPGAVNLTGEAAFGGAVQGLFGSVTTGPAPGPDLSAVRAGGTGAILLDAGGDFNDTLTLYRNGTAIGGAPYDYYVHNATAVTASGNATTAADGTATVTYAPPPQEGRLVLRQGAEAAAARFIGATAEIVVGGLPLRLGGETTVSVSLTGRLAAEFAADPGKLLLAQAYPLAYVGEVPEWDLLALGPGFLPGVALQRSGSEFRGALRLPASLPGGQVPYVLLVWTNASLDPGRPVDVGYAFAPAVSTAPRGASSPWVFGALALVAAAAIAFAYWPLRRRRPERWDGPATVTPR